VTRPFQTPLVIYGRSANIPAGEDLYVRFLGAWDFEWMEGGIASDEGRVKGEWLFSRVLDNGEMHDIFICPSREERLARPYPEAEYCTAIRTYVREKRCMEAVYLRRGLPINFETRLDAKGDISLIMTNVRNYAMVWKFADITENSFHWINEKSWDGGRTWVVQGELFAVRRK
jgi:hypothetical protein